MPFKANQVISVLEARKLLGDEALEMTDEEIQQMIDDFDIIAQHAIKLVQNNRNKSNTTE